MSGAAVVGGGSVVATGGSVVVTTGGSVVVTTGGSVVVVVVVGTTRVVVVGTSLVDVVLRGVLVTGVVPATVVAGTGGAPVLDSGSVVDVVVAGPGPVVSSNGVSIAPGTVVVTERGGRAGRAVDVGAAVVAVVVPAPMGSAVDAVGDGSVGPVPAGTGASEATSAVPEVGALGGGSGASDCTSTAAVVVVASTTRVGPDDAPMVSDQTTAPPHSATAPMITAYFPARRCSGLSRRLPRIIAASCPVQTGHSAPRCGRSLPQATQIGSRTVATARRSRPPTIRQASVSESAGSSPRVTSCPTGVGS